LDFFRQASDTRDGPGIFHFECLEFAAKRLDAAAIRATICTPDL
jgi:hypothetical protein